MILVNITFFLDKINKNLFMQTLVCVSFSELCEAKQAQRCSITHSCGEQ